MRTICISTFIMLLLAACSNNRHENTATENQDKTDSIATEAAQDTTALDGVTAATSVEKSPTFNGIIMVPPQRHATLSLTMSGKIHSLPVMPGQAVKAGQVVATIDNPEYIELQQNYLEAAAQLDYLEKEYERQNSLGTEEAASKKAVQQSKAEWLAMRSRKQAYAARLLTLGTSPVTIQRQGIQPYLQITSPINGYVTRLDANIGKYIDAGEALCDIIDKAHPLLQLTVYEKDLQHIRTGCTLAFRANGMGKKNFHATVVSIDQAVDDKDYSIKVYAKVTTDDQAFRPGMYVRARVSTPLAPIPEKQKR